MKGKIFFLAALTLVQGRPPEDENGPHRHENCPEDQQHFLLPHEANCSKFYYCEFGLKFPTPRDCAPGTHFSFELQICDLPEKVGCVINEGHPENGDETDKDDVAVDEGDIAVEDVDNDSDDEGRIDVSDSDRQNISGVISTGLNRDGKMSLLPNGCSSNIHIHHLLPHENDCTKFYYCVYGEKVLRQCALGLHFNPTTENCDWPAEANCTKSSGVGNEDVRKLDSGSSETTWLENGCPANIHIHHLLPHENDCTKFYYCVRGDKVMRECAPGTHFNPKLQVCDWPRNAGCTSGGNSNNGGSGGDNGGTGGENGGSGGDNGGDNGQSGGGNDGGATGWLPNGCPANIHIHHLLPHETDCTKFYYCVHGQKVLRDCGPGTHFNPTLQVCDWPRNAGCVSSGGNGGSGGENGGNGGSGGENGGNGGSGGGNGGSGGGNGGENDGGGTTWLPNGCPSNIHIHHLLPHESDCTKFYHCVRGEKVIRECAPGTHFNPFLQVCDWPRNAGCTANGGSGGNGGNNNNGGGNGESGGDNGGGSNGGGNGESGGGNGGGNGESGGGNNGGSNGGITWLPNGCPSIHIHHLLPHENDCTKFYYCVYGQKVMRECPPRTHFNPSLQVCDWPQNAGCTTNGGNGGSGGNGGENGGSGGGNGGSGGGNGGGNEGENGGSGGGNSGGENGGSGGGNNGGGNGGENGGSGGGNGGGSNWLPNGCPSNIHIHHLLPHETDCTKFYYCVHGEKVMRECAPGTHFNPTVQVCDWPQNAGCTANKEDGKDGDGNNGGDNGGGGSDGGNNGGDNGGGGSDGGNNGGDNGGGGSDGGNNGGDNGGGGSDGGNNGGDNGGGGSDGGNNGGDNGGGGSDGGNNGGDNGGGGSDDGNNGGDNGGGGSDGGNNGGDNGGGGSDGGNNGGNKCEAGCNVLPWAHDTECSKFWVCDGTKPVQGTCSEGLHFNPETYTCDFICNVSCVRKNILSSVQPDGLKIFLPWNKVDPDLVRRYLKKK